LSLHSFGQFPCGSVQNLSTAQNNQLAAIRPILDSALYHEKLSAIDSVSSVIKSIYGAQAGLPETAETYYPLVSNTSWINLNAAISLSRTLIAHDSIYYTTLWRLAKGQNPQLSWQPHSIYLRYAAEVALGLLKIADQETDAGRKMLYNSWATTALDSLATMQLPNGAFPFPDLRPYGDPVFGPIIQSFLNSCGADSVNVLVNGWIIDDKGTGQFKFDAGVIADVYYQAYQYTHDTHYKNIAIAIGNYLKPLHFSENYNYNTFVSLGLTRAYQLTNDTAYLNRAINNIRYAVFPGQLSTGRWADGHNAKSVYHAIILKNISATMPLIPLTHVYYDSIQWMTEQALRNFLEYYHNCDYSGSYTWAIRTFPLDTPALDAALKDSIGDIIGRHINQSALNGKYLDIPTMGDYLELLGAINSIPETQYPENEIRLYPNPAENSVTIHNSRGAREIVRYQITDMNGRIILSSDCYISRKDIEIDVSALSGGMYFILLSFSDQQRSVRKFIKE
jgi:uncharacterized protein YegP (UPF0339 family)